MLRVGVFGAGGRMGRAVCAAVKADPDLELVAVVDPGHIGETIEGLVAGPGPGALEAAGAEVAVDFTVAAAVLGNAAWCAAHGVHVVIGTTGFGPAALQQVKDAFTGTSANCVVAPNFAIGAVLMMHFAELAAPWFETVEIVELHHDGKLDAPSGTALLMAQRISAARHGGAPPVPTGLAPPVPTGLAPAGTAVASNPAPEPAEVPSPARGVEGAPGVQVHSVRLRGLVAHHEVLLGTSGQVLTLRHDSLDRSSFMPGVVLAVKQVPGRPGLTVGLDALLGL